MPAKPSIRDSLRMPGRDWSLVAAAAAMVALGLAVHNSIVPSYYEHQALRERRAQLQSRLNKAQHEAATLRDTIGALDDPYYIALVMEEKYRWRRGVPPQPAREP